MPVVNSAMNKVAPRFSSQDGKGALALRAYPMEASKKEKLLERIRKNMERAISAESDNRKSGLDDRMFKIGQQWPTEIMAQRNLDKRPCLTVNKLPTFVHQIVNDQRQNRPSININPNGDRGDPDVAKMYRGLIRFIERDCAADIAYDTAFDDAVTMGWGYWRITLEWEAPDSFNCVLVIRQVRNPFSVYLDPAHVDPTGADAKWAFVTQMIIRSEFSDKYPGATQMPYSDGGIGDKVNSWATKDEIRIAEYYEIEYNERILVKLSNGHVGWEDELDDITKGYLKRGKLQKIDERESQVPSVMWYKVTAVDVLKEEEWIGTSIPIVKVIGDATDIEGKLKLSGIIRHAKDPQRMYNYWCPLSLDTPLPTPSGWTTMGEAEAGDTLLDEHGNPCRVVGTSPVHLFRDCFRVQFDDGSHIIADGEHPWQVEERGKRRNPTWEWTTKVVTTSELTPTKHFIPVAGPLVLPDSDLPIDPYLLGAWLGDGATAEPRLVAGDRDIDEMRAILAGLGCRLGAVHRSKNRIGQFTVLGVRAQFVSLGLLGNKHIPEQYLRASRRQREALLQGLMDTDGSVSATKQCSFSTISQTLAEGFAELLRTLGIKAVRCARPGRMSVMPGGNIYDCAPSYQFSFTAPPEREIFRLSRKRAVQNAARASHHRRTKRHRIVSVTPVPSVPVRCVRVDTETHLFLAGPGMVPTHNTAETEMIALQPKAPWVMEEGQGEGHEDEFKNANVKNIPVLYYKGTSVGGTMAPPPQRQPMAGIPAGIVTAKQGSAQDLMATTGIRFDATMNERMIDESGKAIRELRRSGDLGAFHYVDNLARSLRRTGEILVEAIPLVYDETRVVTILREDDKEEQVKIDPALQRPSGEERRPDGKVRKLFNPTYGKYGVTVTIGPSYATKRIEASENMMAFMKALPQTAALVADLFCAQQDWPGAEQIAARLAKTVPPQLMSPDIKDVPPQIQAILSSQENAIKQLTEQLRAAMAQLQDKSADRQVDLDATQKRYEAALLKIIADTEAKMAALNQKSHDNTNTHLVAQAKEFGVAATEAMHLIDKTESEAANANPDGERPVLGGGQESSDGAAAPAQPETIPEEARRHLRPGRHTTFANGTKWTLGADGQPQKVA